MLSRLPATILLTLALFYIYIQVSNAAECSNLVRPVLFANYTPQGKVVMSAGMDTYETGNPNSTKVLIAVYDIYGFTPGTSNIYQICDRLGEYGYRVIMPDFFHGEPWKREHYPYPNDQEFRDFVRQTSWNESVRHDLGLVLEEYQSQNVTEFGIFGFCFGGKITAHAVDEYSDLIKVGAQFHPASVDIYDATRVKSPSLLMPGSNDPDMSDYCTIINILLGAGSCNHRHFTDVGHGYAGGHADWANATLKFRAEEAVGLFEQFLCIHFPAL